MNFRLSQWVWKRRPRNMIPNDAFTLLALAQEAGSDGFSRTGLISLATLLDLSMDGVKRSLLRLAKGRVIWIKRCEDFRAGLLERANFELLVGIRTPGFRFGPSIPTDKEDGPLAEPPPSPRARHLALVPPRQTAAGATRPILGSQRRILTALARRPEGLTRKQLAIRAKVWFDSGAFERTMATLRDKGWVTARGPMKETRLITDTGLAALGTYAPSASDEGILQYWIGALPPGESLMLAKLAAIHPEGMSRTQLGKETQRLPDSPAFALDLSELKAKALVVELESLIATEELFK